MDERYNRGMPGFLRRPAAAAFVRGSNGGDMTPPFALSFRSFSGGRERASPRGLSAIKIKLLVRKKTDIPFIFVGKRLFAL